MAFSDQSLRVGRTQATLFFWGLVSLCFATAACFYFWKSSENESKANRLRDEVLNLQTTCDTLASEKQRLQAGNADENNQLQQRASILEQKEKQLNAEEARLAALGQKPAIPPPAPSPQAAELKKFDDGLKAFAPAGNSETITRGSVLVLRVNSTVFFDPGESTLQPAGKTLLGQIVQALKGQTTGVELRVETFTDSNAETKPAASDKPHPSAPWDLTSLRALALSCFFRDQGSLPPQMLLIVSRGDSLPVAGKDDRAKNRRIEISLTPAPDPSYDPLAPPPDTPATATAKTDK